MRLANEPGRPCLKEDLASAALALVRTHRRFTSLLDDLLRQRHPFLRFV